MGKKLFVGGLSWNTSDSDLAAAFEKFGEVVDAKVISDRGTGRSKGFGFVTFTDASAAAKAMQELDDTELDGRRIRVNEAQERTGGDRRPGGGGGGPRRDGGGGRGGRGGGRGGRGGGGYGGGDW